MSPPFGVISRLAVIALFACLGDDDDTTDEPTDPAVEPVPVRSPTPGVAFVAARTARPCADPSARANDPWKHRKASKLDLGPTIGHRLVGGALGVGDFDNNGHLDVFVPGERSSQLHLGRGAEEFQDVASTHLSGLDLSGTTSVVVVDLDDDADLDLYITRFQRTNLALLNDGGGRFVDATAIFPGIDAGERRSMTAAFGDMDGDGDLDLFVGAYGPRPAEGLDTGAAFEEIADPAVLLERDGDAWIDRSDRLPQIVHDAYNFNAAWLDVDDDLDQDLIVINDFGWARPSQLLYNDGTGHFTQAPVDQGFSAPFAGMGLGIGDLNGDAVPDFAQSSWREASVLSSAAGAWWEQAPAWGVIPDIEQPRNQIFGWGTALVDVDNDADLDLPMVFGHWDEYRGDLSQRDALWIWDGVRFTDEARKFGVDDDGAGRALSVADVNADGWPDLIKRQISDTTPMHLSVCGTNEWLHVRLRASAPNIHAIGARISVTAGGREHLRWIQAGGQSMMTGEPPEALFGLGDASTIDAVRVTWPDGRTSVHTDVRPSERIVLVQVPR